MKLTDGTLTFSATDLSNFIACRHKTQLDRQVAFGSDMQPAKGDPYAEIVKELGRKHEENYVAYLRQQGFQIADLRPDGTELDQFERTERAMAEGAQIIIQAALRHNNWMGYADILYKVNTPGKWEWSYEVGDTKLAQTTKAGTILQLCVYSDILAQIQELVPESFYVIKPGLFADREEFRYADYAAYYRFMQEQFALNTADERTDTYPHPVAHCEVCQWWKQCEEKRRADDHLCQVAGMHTSHIRQLQEINVNTMAGFAIRETAFDGRPAKGSIHTFERLHRQAGIQHQGRIAQENKYAFLQPDVTIEGVEEAGLARLPLPSEGDVFFDIEGDRFHEEGGLEYLLGIVYQNEGVWQYKGWWALNRKEEKAAFEALMDFLMQRLEAYPDYHIYHFAPYEPSALKHLMLRHSTRIEDVDWLLRGERLIDLHAIVKQSLIASVEQYGLKQLEPFFEFPRNQDLKDARWALIQMQRSLELQIPEGITDEVKAVVQAYNAEDCFATQALRGWLEELRIEFETKHGPVSRSPLKTGEASDTQEEKRTRIKDIFDKLMAMLPEDQDTFTEEHKAIHLLAYLLEYFAREDKNFWWEYYSRKEMEFEDLLEDRKAIVGLQLLEDPPAPGKGLPTHRYSYPFQELSMSGRETVCDLNSPEGEKDDIGTIIDFDLKKRIISVKKRGAAVSRHPSVVQLKKQYPSVTMENAILEFAEQVCQHGLEGTAIHPAARDLLMRHEPRLVTSEMRLIQPGESSLDRAIRSAKHLDQSVLPIQGPPGTGKTYTGSQMILALLKEGATIGITAVSHKVIDNFLKRIHKEAGNTPVELYHLGNEPPSPPEGIIYIDKNAAHTTSGDGKLLGATVFHWSSPQSLDTLDYLFIDEAGQMSLAYVLAASRCAKNLVLLGDPQQLEQPQQAAHPEGSDVSALSHYIGGEQTIAEDRGIFLNTTWRLHPEICGFTSELYYDGKLHALSSLDAQILHGSHPFAFHPLSGNPGAGLYYVPAAHSGNSNQSDEEIAVITRIVRQLLSEGSTWTHADDKAIREKPLTKEDIMIIAPFNAQVAALQDALPDLHIGTVDKFQGGEAAVVIYSMASSSVEDAPRGMSFLFAPNRLNVASSRARCAFILVASPRLFEVECTSPAQMQWANGMCRFREVAREVEV